MDEESARLAQLLMEEDEAELMRNGYRYYNINDNGNRNDDGGWQTVSYHKRNKKFSKQENHSANGGAVSDVQPDVFRSVEQHSEDRRRKILESQQQLQGVASGDGSRRNVDEDSGDSGAEDQGEANGGDVGGEAKKAKKAKKPKKPKVTVAEAAAKIDAGDLGAFLVDVTASFESQQDIQLMRFADYFGRAFASVPSAQFPWLKLFKESAVSKIVDIPVAHVSQDVYKTAVDWLGQRSQEALGSFVLWSLDAIFADFANHQGATAAKGSKKPVQQSPSRSQVAIFVVLAMTVRRRPELLINLLPIIMENPKYQGQDKLPVIVWVFAQASQGDLVVGLYVWTRALLPMLGGKLSSNPQSRDLILQLVERILSSPKARQILVNGAVKKGERVVPPSALELLMRLTFPSSRVKATERFEVVYPTLKEVALAGSSGSKAMKQVTQQILNLVVKPAGEGVPDLSREACEIFIWCLIQNPDCYKQWESFYLDNIEASVAVLRKLSDEWKEHSLKHASLDPLRATVKSFRQKNEEALAKQEYASRQALLKDADKYCKTLMGQTSRSHGWVRSMLIVSAALAAGAAVASQNEHWDLQKLSAMLNLPTY